MQSLQICLRACRSKTPTDKTPFHKVTVGQHKAARHLLLLCLFKNATCSICLLEGKQILQ